MQFHIKYPWITNQIFIALHQQLKCFNHECQRPIAHSVFKQTVHNVGAQHAQQHTIEICCRMIQISYQWTHEANHSILSTKRCFRSAFCWRALSRVFDSVRTRGHSYKLFLPDSRINCRQHFFAVRVVRIWNSLPEDIVSADQLSFVRLLNRVDLSQFLVGKA